MFIRIKTIKNQHYAYAVENIWKKRKKEARQLVKGYLGKVQQLELKDETLTFEGFIGKDAEKLQDYFKNTSSRALIRDIVGYELAKYGFKKKRQTWVLEDIKVNLSELKVTKSERSVALQLYNDFLCDLTLRNLLHFKSGADQETTGKELANAFIQAGIPIRQDLFIAVFQKVYRRGLSIVG